MRQAQLLRVAAVHVDIDLRIVEGGVVAEEAEPEAAAAQRGAVAGALVAAGASEDGDDVGGEARDGRGEGVKG